MTDVITLDKAFFGKVVTVAGIFKRNTIAAIENTVVFNNEASGYTFNIYPANTFTNDVVCNNAVPKCVGVLVVAFGPVIVDIDRAIFL